MYEQVLREPIPADMLDALYAVAEPGALTAARRNGIDVPR
jgi:hypothetical protein